MGYFFSPEESSSVRVVFLGEESIIWVNVGGGKYEM